ncbi:hypothetical protein M3647_21230 [Paenibacillus cellulositrophicus]|uniref:hypothetical protein n=1 Tax=Paenibacillus cellulositrophicus TaxID=562959 RepID=UPI00203CE546|nr:hypothetical protein [Paenibacillus cellulositrophicus]MCM3000001.1 hypothetical protein [Paenibacillus cellulositrophicus]
MYGHQFYRLSANDRAEFLNVNLKKKECQELQQIVNELRIDEADLRTDMAMYGWYYIAELKRFVKIEAEQAS